jgi:hypothetical protein
VIRPPRLAGPQRRLSCGRCELCLGEGRPSQRKEQVDELDTKTKGKEIQG